MSHLRETSVFVEPEQYEQGDPSICPESPNGEWHVTGPQSFADLRDANPELRPAIVDGLVRRGETANVISAAKVGKSWLVYSLALSIIAGLYWLRAFRCTKGRVLLIDNELHPATIANRIPKVAAALGLDAADYESQLDVLSLRGQNVSLPQLGRIIENIEAGHYSAIIADAWYRFLPQGMNENSNADVMALYNMLDNYAGQTDAAWFVVHHSSKGVQGEKRTTDVGAGAGAQSRAADSHLILREHEEPGAVVLEAAVRSFAPIEPVGLRWEFPTWERDYDLDVGAVKGRKSHSEERQTQRDREGMDAICKALAVEPLTPRHIRDETGMSKDRTERLLGLLYSSGEVTFKPIRVRGNDTREYSLSSL